MTFIPFRRMQLFIPLCYKDESNGKMFHQKSFKVLDVFRAKKMPINGPKTRPIPV